MRSMLPNKRTLVIHLRTGDVIDRSNVSMRNFLLFNNATIAYGCTTPYTRGLPFYAAKWDEIQRDRIEIDTILVITGWHNALFDHSRSIVYINRVMEYLEGLVDTVILRLNENPDEDFIIMAASPYFVRSGGGFSQTIATLVQKNGGRVFLTIQQSMAALRARKRRKCRSSLFGIIGLRKCK